MSAASHLLLHGSSPWLIPPAALDPLRDALRDSDGSPPRLELRGERLPAGTSHGIADVLVLAPAPADLESMLDLDASAPGLVAVADLRVPGWTPEREVQSGPHVFHVYRRPHGIHAVTFDEAHQLAVVHPQYDGFLVSQIVARRDIDDFRLVATGQLAAAVTPHHLEGPLLRGQLRAADLELHPGIVPDRGLHGTIAACDGDDLLGSALELTLVTTAAVECVLAGLRAGPIRAPDFTELVERLRAGEVDGRDLSRAIAAAEGEPEERAGSGWRRWRR